MAKYEHIWRKGDRFTFNISDGKEYTRIVSMASENQIAFIDDTGGIEVLDKYVCTPIYKKGYLVSKEVGKYTVYRGPEKNYPAYVINIDKENKIIPGIMEYMDVKEVDKWYKDNVAEEQPSDG